MRNEPTYWVGLSWILPETAAEKGSGYGALLIVLILIFTDDTLLAQSVLVDMFPNPASTPVKLLVAMVDAVMYLLLRALVATVIVEMVLATTWPDGKAVG